MADWRSWASMVVVYMVGWGIGALMGAANHRTAIQQTATPTARASIPAAESDGSKLQRQVNLRATEYVIGTMCSGTLLRAEGRSSRDDRFRRQGKRRRSAADAELDWIDYLEKTSDESATGPQGSVGPSPLDWCRRFLQDRGRRFPRVDLSEVANAAPPLVRPGTQNAPPADPGEGLSE